MHVRDISTPIFKQGLLFQSIPVYERYFVYLFVRLPRLHYHLQLFRRFYALEQLANVRQKICIKFEATS